MKKEVILAITIGFGIGLVLTFFLYKAQPGLPSSSEILSPLGSGKVVLNLSPSPSQTLSIISPIDQSVSKERRTIITGVASPSSWIIILGEKGEKVIQADEKGNFETDLLLVSGENEITITSVGKKGDEISKVITIVYSTAEI